MASGGMRQCIKDITPYLLLLIFISTLGPLQFGFHLVCDITASYWQKLVQLLLCEQRLTSFPSLN